MTSNNMEHIVWMNMQTTGPDIEKDHILEISCLITDKLLNLYSSEEVDIIIHHSDIVLNNMNAWCMENYQKNCLIEDCRLSTTSLEAAEIIILNFLQKYIPKNTCPLAGNSIYMDRLFLYKYMPLVNNYLHYRIIDVSTIRELTRRWNPNIYERTSRKTLYHRASQDMKESIEELSYYQKDLFMSFW